jgi:hypothetical protein
LAVAVAVFTLVAAVVDRWGLLEGLAAVAVGLALG